MNNSRMVSSGPCLVSCHISWFSFTVRACMLLLIATGCATTEDLKTVQVDLNEARRIAYENRNTIREIGDRFAINETGRRSANGEAELPREQGILSNIRQNQAELGLRLEDLSRETRLLHGRLDEIQHDTEQTIKELNDQKDLLMIRISALEERVRLFSPTSSPTQTPLIMPTQPTGIVPPGTGVISPLPTPGTEETLQQEKPDESALALYKRGHNLYKSKDFVKARETFKSFLEIFPNHEYAGNAQFWIGETYYSEKDYENAILAYEDVLRKHRQSEKVPAAMLKQGYAFVELGDERTARVLLDGVEKKFPGTHQAELAKRKLKAMSKTR